jgi:hypothetical protein
LTDSGFSVPEYIDELVRFEISTAATMKNTIFLDMAPCRYCVIRRFGGTYRLHLQGRKILERGSSVSMWLQTVGIPTICRRVSANPVIADLEEPCGVTPSETNSVLRSDYSNTCKCMSSVPDNHVAAAVAVTSFRFRLPWQCDRTR